MTASTPLVQRRRRRRGTLERPIDGRLFRAALLVTLLPLLLLALTVSTPEPLAKPALPETFDGAAALALTRSLAEYYPDRAPGTLGAGDAKPYAGATAWFEQQLQDYHLDISAETWTQDVQGRGRVELTNIAAVAPGQSHDAIVVMAHRDDLGTSPGADDNASGTAVLLELARAYAEPSGILKGSVQSAHTLIFLSTDGGSFGELGAVYFLAHYHGRIAAVINLDALAGQREPRLVIAGDEPRSPSPTLVATASARIAEQVGKAPAHVGALGQLIDLGFPITLYEQGPFLAARIPAITLTTESDRPSSAFGDNISRLQPLLLTQMGEATQELLGSLNEDVALVPTTSSFVWVAGRSVSGWAIELFFVSLLLPLLVVLVDVFALCRRNAVAFRPALSALRNRLSFWLFAGLVFTCFRLAGWWPGGPSRPPNPAGPLTEHIPALTLVLFGALLLAGWYASRPRATLRRRPQPEEQLAGWFVALLTVVLVGILTAVANPFSLLFVLPPAYAWLWLPQLRLAHPFARLGAYAAGLVGPALVLVSLGWRFGLGFRAPWYLLELLSNGTISTPTLLLALVGAAASAQLAAAAIGRYLPYPSEGERRPGGPLRGAVRIGTSSLRAGLRIATRGGEKVYSPR